MDKFVTSTAFSPDSPATSRPVSVMDEPVDNPQPGSSQEEFLTIVPEAVQRFYASSKRLGKLRCRACNREISFANRSSKSNFGLKSHYERKHTGELSAFKAALEGASKRGRSTSGSRASSTLTLTDVSFSGNTPAKKKLYQSNIEAQLMPKFNQKKTLMLYYDLFIGNIMPAIITDSPQMKALMQQLNPQFKPPSRRQMNRDINKLGDKAKATMATLLAEVSHVATTADSWSAHNRGFLGMTVHWINKTNLKREKAVLGVKEVTVRQVAAYLSRAIMELHEEFGLSQKVVSTTTDNGSNYVAAFAHFAGKEDGVEEVGTLLHPVGDDEEEDDSATILVGDALNEEEGVADLLHNHRCAAHTLNLMATTDIRRVPGWNSGKRAPFTKLAGKAQGLWNCQNRRTVAANDIKDAVGKKLPTPGATRWNSYFDSCEALVKVLDDKEEKERLVAAMRGQDLQAFTELDRELLAEYVKILKPVAICLDTLQSEGNAYMGILLPHLRLLKDTLESLKTDATIIHGQNLVEYLMDNPDNRAAGGRKRIAFNGRFGHLFEDEDLLMAVALHPHYKMNVVEYLNPALQDTIKRRIVQEMKAKVGYHNGNGNDDAPVLAHPSTFSYMKAARRPLSQQRNVEEDLEKTLYSWTELDVQNDVPLSPDMFPMEHREIWVNLFIRYNTPVPSSAAVERLFSIASDIIRPKRSRLTANTFEKLVFLKGNMTLLKDSWDLEDSDEG